MLANIDIGEAKFGHIQNRTEMPSYNLMLIHIICKFIDIKTTHNVILYLSTKTIRLGQFHTYLRHQ